MKARIIDLRYNMKAVLAALDRGEPVTVLHRGKERARLVPIDATEKTNSGAHPAFGMWRSRKDLEDVTQYVRRIRQPRFDQ